MAIGATIDDRPVFAKARRAQRLRRTFLVGVAVLAVSSVVALVGAVRDPGFMPVTQVRVEGEFRQLTREALQAAIASTVAGGFFTVDIGAVRRAALRSPWVATAAVRRVWPDGLIVTVTEQRAAARWGAAAVLNEDGGTFTPDPATISAGLVQLLGPDNTERMVLERWSAFKRVLDAIGLKARRVTMDERRAWTVQLDNGVELLLGRDDVVERLRRFADAYGNALAPRAADLAAVDLRYTNGFAARWRGASH
jgi:cell division protein FtsQ